jgi:hypothetical protein
MSSESSSDSGEGDSESVTSDSMEDSEESEDVEYDQSNVRVGEVVAQVGNSKGSSKVWLGLVVKVERENVTVVYLEPNSSGKKESMLERCRGTWDKSRYAGGKTRGQEWEQVVPYSSVCALVKFEEQAMWKPQLKLGKRWDQLQGLVTHVAPKKITRKGTR